MKRNTRKNWILSLVLAIMMFFGVGVTVTTHKASAEVLDIYAVEGANFFDIEADYTIENTLSDLAGGQNYAVSYAPSFNGFRVEILDSINTDFALEFALIYSDSTLGPLRDMTIGGNYSFSCRILFPNSSTDSQAIGVTTNWTSGRTLTYEIMSDMSANIPQSNLDAGGVIKVSFSIGIAELQEEGYYDWSNNFQTGDVFYLSDIAVFYGTQTYAYSPYYYSIADDDSGSDDGAYSDGYSDGYADGESAGYDKGFADGSKFAEYGIFGFCQCYIQLNYADGQWDRISITDDFYIYGGLDLSKFKPLVESYTNVSSSFIFFNFPDLRFAMSQLKFFGTGSETVFDPWAVTLSNTESSRNLTWSKVPASNDNNPIYQTDVFSPGVIGSTVVQSFKTPYFETFAYLDDFTITMSDSQYYVGYENGYNNGILSNNETVYNEGLEEGKIIGEDIGFKKGLAQGMSGDPYGLGEFMYSFIDMPGRILSNWLNFEFMGLNLMGLVTFLLSIALVAFVLKKVV